MKADEVIVGNKVIIGPSGTGWSGNKEYRGLIGTVCSPIARGGYVAICGDLLPYTITADSIAKWNIPLKFMGKLFVRSPLERVLLFDGYCIKCHTAKARHTDEYRIALDQLCWSCI